MRPLMVVIPLAALAALSAACGGSSPVAASSPGSSSSSPAPTVTDTVVLPATPGSQAPATTSGQGTATTSPTAPTACATGNLTVSLNGVNGDAGSEVYALHLTNKGSAACTVRNFPGVSFVAPATGKQVGIPATRTTTTGSTITLATGAQATAMLRITEYLNYPTATCAATAVSGLRVYPPDNTSAAYVALPAAGPTMACGGAVPQLEIQPFTAGAGTP